MQSMEGNSRSLDHGVLLAVFALCGLGLVQVYSSSFIYATDTKGDGLYFFLRQLMILGLGMIVLLVTPRIPFKWLQKGAVVIWILGIVALGATLVTGLQHSAGGASRWIRLTPAFVFEPSELVKVALGLFVASWVCAEGASPLNKFVRTILFVVPLFIILKQPDFGTAVILAMVAFGVLFIYGLRWRYIMGLIMISMPVAYFYLWRVPFRRARLMAYLDPWAEADNKGFQMIQSLLSFHSGGLTGVGLGEGQGKLFFLPEAHTDFTMAVLGEEIGFIGFFAVMTLYGFLVFRGFSISGRAQSVFGRSLALTLTLVFAASVVVNCAVVLGLLPTKGLPMPFLSYGGSSLLCNCLLFGLLLNVSRHDNSGKPLVKSSKSKLR